MKRTTAILVACLFATPVLAAGTDLNTTATTGTTVSTTTPSKVNTDHAKKGSDKKEVSAKAQSKDDVKIKTAKHKHRAHAGAAVDTTTTAR